jgi:hypothetical protein
MLYAYDGKCLSRKAVHSWVEKFSQGKVETEVAETTVRKILFCGFRLTGKAMGQVYQCCKAQ